MIAVREPISVEWWACFAYGPEEARRLAAGPESAIERAENQRLVRRFMSRLSRAQITVLRRRFGFDDEPETLKEVGARLGVGQERVRRIQLDAIAILRYEIVRSSTTLERIMGLP